MYDYAVHLATLACIFSIAVVALQLVVSDTGLLSVAHAVFLAVGAYNAALISTRLGLGSLTSFAAAAAAAFLVSLLVSVPSLRLRDDYFAIATFGLQMISSSVLINWVPVTNGPMGISDIPPLSLGGISVRSAYAFFAVSLIAAILAIFICDRIHLSRYGLVLRAIKSDELFAQSLGKSTFRFKIQIVGLSSVLVSLAGVLYAHFLGFIDPSSFTLMDSVLLLSMVVIGGPRPLGAAGGAFLLILFPEAMRFLGLPSALAANLRQIFYGLLLILVIAFRPQGLFWIKGTVVRGDTK